MTAGTVPDRAAQAFAVAARVTQLDQFGNIAVGAASYVTDALMKMTFAPDVETGDDLVSKNANGDIPVRYKHGDMIKYYTGTLALQTPDPFLEAIISGGTVINDNSTGISGTPGTVTATPAITGGVLPAASYFYKVTAANVYGETLPSAEATGVVASGTTGSVALSLTPVAGAVYYKWYGRTTGAEQLIAMTRAAAFTDTGLITPSGALPLANSTAGPGNGAGYQAPALGIVGNPNGFGLELWCKAIKNGVQDPILPYFWWTIPHCQNFRVDSREFTDALLVNQYLGQCFENTQWGAGPFGDYPGDTSKAYQRQRVGPNSLPTVSLLSQPATV